MFNLEYVFGVIMAIEAGIIFVLFSAIKVGKYQNIQKEKKLMSLEESYQVLLDNQLAHSNQRQQGKNIVATSTRNVFKLRTEKDVVPHASISKKNISKSTMKALLTEEEK